MEHCPACHRAGDSAKEIQERCGNFITCAMRTETVDPRKEVLIECPSCDVKLAVPVSRITSGKRLDTGKVCQRASDSCLAEIVMGEGQVARAPRGKSAKA